MEWRVETAAVPQPSSVPYLLVPQNSEESCCCSAIVPGPVASLFHGAVGLEEFDIA